MQTSKIKNCIIVSILITLAILFCASFNAKPTYYTRYTVRQGDTLYSVAEDYGVKNWRKWSYEVCELNGIEQGGMIYPGQIIVVPMDGR